MPRVTPADLLAAVAQGESERVEFKRALPPDHIVARNLTAFANTSGGLLIVGVGDDGEIIGLGAGEAALVGQRLGQIADSLFSSRATVEAVDLLGKYVVYAAVDPAPQYVRPVLTASGELYERRGEQSVRVSADAELAELRSSPAPPKPTPRACTVFVAMSFREEQEPALVDYFRAMQRAVEATELPITLVRIDLHEGDYEISQEVMDEIGRCDVVLADFTLSPANVYFEIGYARGARKRVIQTARKDTALEFDVRNFRTLFYRNATELEQKLVAALQKAYAEVTGQ